ncbi:F-box/FBD/LRR-repeat protein At1g13570-like [Bidens hawaiensis]|uniref:F-box/FBD/LRR-repeat protein At1g13570-like n=1 Tax=Bidens hawaiensis TaxID=980011 RepID=UPI00404B1F6E
MEVIHGRRKTREFEPEDFISRMPDNVLTNILDRLPIQDAVRTSILSSNWRFNWTMLSQLVFDDNFFTYLSKTKAKNNYKGIISRILLHVKGVIAKFVLAIDNHDYPKLDDEDVNNWILFLSIKGIKDLTIVNSEDIVNLEDTELELSTHLFSCLELKHLKLHNCCFDPLPTFQGFPNLLSLDLSVKFGENTELGKFFTRCPLLESLTLDDLFLLGKIKAVDIVKIESLKTLTLQLCDLEKTCFTSSCTLFELLGCLPYLQALDLDFYECDVRLSVANKTFSIAFPCLKALKLSRICFDDSTQLLHVFELIRSCPNVRTLEITETDRLFLQNAASHVQVDYNTPGLLQLRNVMFECRKGLENKVCLIKYLLASSPYLKKIVIRPYSPSLFTSDEKFAFAMKLLKLHRASPVAEIDLLQF